MTYINRYSWKCLLGKQSKNITEENDLYFWQVGPRQNFCTGRDLTTADLPLLTADLNFHYLSEENVKFLMEQNIKLDKGKNQSTLLDLSQFTIAGNKFKSLRHAVNRGKGYNLTVEDSFRDIKNVETMLEEWSNVISIKYFRDNSGKNAHFYRNNFHQDCLSVFLYDKDGLVSFGTASPEINGSSAYIMGKALCNRYYGLSEYTDYLLYQKLIAHNISKIDLGQTTKGLIHYKNKFPGSQMYTYYNGNIK